MDFHSTEPLSVEFFFGIRNIFLNNIHVRWGGCYQNSLNELSVTPVDLSISIALMYASLSDFIEEPRATYILVLRSMRKKEYANSLFLTVPPFLFDSLLSSLALSFNFCACDS